MSRKLPPVPKYIAPLDGPQGRSDKPNPNGNTGNGKLRIEAPMEAIRTILLAIIGLFLSPLGPGIEKRAAEPQPQLTSPITGQSVPWQHEFIRLQNENLKLMEAIRQDTLASRQTHLDWVKSMDGLKEMIRRRSNRLPRSQFFDDQGRVKTEPAERLAATDSLPQLPKEEVK